MDLEPFTALPRGFGDVDGTSIDRERRLVDIHAAVARSIGCTPVRTAPLGFASTFCRGASTTGDKVFEFADRGNRRLMLAPDSTPGVMRYCLADREFGAAPKRIAFMSPLFRYRRTKRRHFHQIGFALLNELPASTPVDLHALQLADAGCRLFKAAGIAVRVSFQDFAALRKHLHAMERTDEEADAILDALRRVPVVERQSWIGANLPEGPDRRAFATLLTLDPVPVRPDGTVDAPMPSTLPSALLDTVRAFALARVATATIDSTELHASEIHDGLAFRYVAADGTHVGDGGSYNRYGRRFDGRIVSLKSMATGLEATAAIMPASASDAMPRVDALILVLDASASYVFQVSTLLRDTGVSLVVRTVHGSMKTILRNAVHTARSVVVLGAREEAAGRFVRRHLDEGTEDIFEVGPNPL